MPPIFPPNLAGKLEENPALRGTGFEGNIFAAAAAAAALQKSAGNGGLAGGFPPDGQPSPAESEEAVKKQPFLKFSVNAILSTSDQEDKQKQDLVAEDDGDESIAEEENAVKLKSELTQNRGKIPI